MNVSPQAACTLDAAARRERYAEWEAVLRQAVQREEIAGGARYRFPAGEDLERRLRALAAAELECCSFYDLAVARREDSVELTVTAPPAAQDRLRSLFR